MRARDASRRPHIRRSGRNRRCERERPLPALRARGMLSTNIKCRWPSPLTRRSLCWSPHSMARASVRRMFSEKAHLADQTMLQPSPTKRSRGISENLVSRARPMSFSVSRGNGESVETLRAFSRAFTAASQENLHFSCTAPRPLATPAPTCFSVTPNPNGEESVATMWGSHAAPSSMDNRGMIAWKLCNSLHTDDHNGRVALPPS